MKNKLLSKVYICGGAQLMASIDYDEFNRIIKLEHYIDIDKPPFITFLPSYNNDNEITSITKKYNTHSEIVSFTKHGNDILIKGDLHIKALENIDTNGLPSRVVSHDGWYHDYQYDEKGNIKSITISNEAPIYYFYDDKKAPFFSCISPKWFFLLYFEKKYINNIIKSVYGGASSLFRYTYDKDGYPLKYYRENSDDELESYVYIEI